MKKIEVNFDDITQEVMNALAKQYPQGFMESDIVSFSHLNSELEDRIKLIIGDTSYLVKKSIIEDWASAKYEEGYFKSSADDDPPSDVDI